jgi:hypothetical protein
VSPTTHALSAVVGHTLTVSWQLPRTYATTHVELNGSVSDARTVVYFEQRGNTGATSGTIDYPATMPGSGNAIVQAGMQLSIDGPNGEHGTVRYIFE